MVRSNRNIGSLLALVFGLIFSPFAYAQTHVGPTSPVRTTATLALNYCQEAAIQGEIDLNHPASPAQAFSISPNCTKHMDPTFGGIGYFALGIAGWIPSTGGGPYYSAPGNYNFYSYAVFRSFPFETDDSEPEVDPCSTSTNFDSTDIMASTPNGSGDTCHNGCRYSVAVGYSGTYPSGYMYANFQPMGSSCEPGDGYAPSAPISAVPVPPESGGVDTSVPDPGPGPDENGNGVSSGGGSCDAPPACSGDSIQCNILFQTWSTRCEAKRIADTSGGGDEEPGQDNSDIVDGLASVDSSVQGLNQGLTNINQSVQQGLANLSNNDPWRGKLDDPGSTDLSQFVEEETWGVGMLNDNGMGLSRACPNIPQFNVNFFGHVTTIDFGSRLCQDTAWISGFVVFLGFLAGAFAYTRTK